MSFDPVFLPSNPSRPQIDVHPRPEATDPEPTRARKAFQKATLGDQPNTQWGGNGFGVDDFIDLVNPLQHLPVVGNIYRAATGDTLSKEAQIMGGALFGGPVGLAAAGMSALIEQESGQNLAEHAMALVKDSPASSDPVKRTLNPTDSAAPMKLSQIATRTVITPPQVTPPSIEKDEEVVAEQNASPLPTSHSVMPEYESGASSPLPAELQKHDAILELFGAGVSSVHRDYHKTQMMEHVMRVTKALVA